MEIHPDIPTSVPTDPATLNRHPVSSVGGLRNTFYTGILRFVYSRPINAEASEHSSTMPPILMLSTTVSGMHVSSNFTPLALHAAATRRRAALTLGAILEGTLYSVLRGTGGSG